MNGGLRLPFFCFWVADGGAVPGAYGPGYLSAAPPGRTISALGGRGRSSFQSARSSKKWGVKRAECARSFNETATSSFQSARSFNLPAEGVAIVYTCRDA